MDRDDPYFHHDRPRASLRDAAPLLAEMIRQIMEEEGGDLSFFSADLEDDSYNLGVLLGEERGIHCMVVGSHVVSAATELDDSGLGRLRQRGWWRTGDGDAGLSEKMWGGVTTQTDRRHVAKDMIGVLTDVYQVDADRKLYVRLCLKGGYTLEGEEAIDREEQGSES
jgi:hypothetical protein